MAQIKLTAAQEKAVYHGGGNLLISAAAGSGKTATLSGRIAELVISGRGQLSRMLIVTFTRASAGEMRERISRKLHEAAEQYRGGDPEVSSRISRALAELPSAEISTIHSFLYKALKPYFGTIGISADSRIVEQQVIKPLRRECMKSVVDDYFDGNLLMPDLGEEKIASFTELADVIGQVRDTSTIDGELLWLEEKLQSCGESPDDLNKYADKLNEIGQGKLDPMQTEFGAQIRGTLRKFEDHYQKLLRYYAEELPWEEVVWEKYSPNHAYMSRWIDELIVLLKDDESPLEAYVRLFDGYAPPRLGTLKADKKTELSEKFREHREEMKKDISRLTENYFQSDREETQFAAKNTARILRSLAVVLTEFREKLTRRKRSMSSIEYNDLEEYATKLFLDYEGNVMETAIEVGNKYDWIFIDEYQDTNRVQDRIFCAVSGSASRFIVGDIKQSIYRFRGANPEVFAEYRKNWTGEDGESIFMSENFRCDRGVIDFVNMVSRHTLGRSSIPYELEDELVCGKITDQEALPVEVCLIEKNTDTENKYTTNPSERNPEAWYVAQKVRDMIGRYSPDGKSVLKPSDVAVILRSPSTAGQDYIDSLAMLGIPAAMKTSKKLDEYASVMLLICILRMVNNPLDDVYLAGALRSPIFGFTASELIELREYAGEMPLYFGLENADMLENGITAKYTKIIQWIKQQRVIADGVSVEKYLEQLIETVDIRSIKGIRGNGIEMDAIRKFVSLAKTYENTAADGRNGIAGFLEYLENAIAESESGSGETQADCVQVISIHGSKGLEYPVVFLSECAKQRNAQDEQRTILYETDMGLGMFQPDFTGLTRSDNLIRRAVADKIRTDSIEEEMRMLYVALTRARNRLIITGKVRDPDKILRESEWDASFADEWTVTKTGTYLDWILQSCALCKNNKPYQISVIENDTENDEQEIPADQNNGQELSEIMETETLSKSFCFRYKWDYLEEIPSKLTVSRLNPEILDEYETTENTTDIQEETSLDEMKIPVFLSGENESRGRMRGNATHKFLQFVRFNDLKEYGYETELNRLITHGYLSERESEMINIQHIQRFIRSRLLEKILRSGFVKREFRFNHRMPAADFTENEEKKRNLDENQIKITVQGVVDCVFRDPDTGKLVLVDYKTDSLTSEEWKEQKKAEEKLRNRHKNQLEYYGKICAELFGEPISGIYIYSTVLGRLIEI